MKKNIDISFFFFVFFLMTLSLGQLVRLNFLHWENAIFYPHDIVIAIAFFVHILTRKIFTVPNLSRPKHLWLPITLLAWISLGWGIAYNQHALALPAILTAIRLAIYVSFMLCLVSTIQTASAQCIRFCLFFTTFLMGVWGILQYIFLPDVRFLHTFGWDDHYYRLIGPLLDPNFAGLLAIMALFYWQSCAQTVKRYAQQILYSGVTLFHCLNSSVWLIALTSLAMTFSRSSWLALIGSLTLVALWPKTCSFISLKITGVWLLILIGGYLLLPKPTGEGVDITRTSTISARSDLNHYLLSSLQPLDWVIGKGAFNFRIATEAKTTHAIPTTAIQPDNLFIQLVGSIGLGGVVLLALLLWQNRRLINRLDPWLIGILLAVLIHAQFNNSLFQPHIWLLLIAGLAKPLSVQTA